METMYKRNIKGSRNKFKEAKIIICGVGGIGSNLAISLARAGVGELLLIDFDIVEASNLNRQAYRLKDLGKKKTRCLAEILKETGSDTRIITSEEKITEENIGRFLEKGNIICECVDKAPIKAMIAENSIAAEKPLIASSGMAGTGKGNEIKSRKIMENFYIAGDMKSDFEKTDGMMAPHTQICAGHMADIVITGIIENRF